jgi:hypothetical protein
MYKYTSELRADELGISEFNILRIACVTEK